MGMSTPPTTDKYHHRNLDMVNTNRKNANEYGEAQLHARMDDNAMKDTLKSADRAGGYI